jgi:hypothetical protein
MFDQGFVNTLSPVELQFFQSYAYKLIQEKVTAETQNYENLTGSICECPTCHCRYIRKKRAKNHRQRYECKNKDCKHRFFTVTTGTYFYHSKNLYYTWLAFLGCELNHLTLEQEAVVIGRTVTTCFNMPRISNERGKHKISLHGKNLADVGYHKVYIITAMDETTIFLIELAGLNNELIMTGL